MQVYTHIHNHMLWCTTIGLESFLLIQNCSKTRLRTCNEWLLQPIAIVFTHSPDIVHAGLKFHAHVYLIPPPPCHLKHTGCVWCRYLVNLTLCSMSWKALEIQSVVSTSPHVPSAPHILLVRPVGRVQDGVSACTLLTT